jgi:hypothetical protein
MSIPIYDLYVVLLKWNFTVNSDGDLLCASGPAVYVNPEQEQLLRQYAVKHDSN